MRLTSFTGCALRLLILAGAHPDKLVTIEEAATACDISHAHLKKVVPALAKAAFIAATKGRNGGFALARPPAEISIADVVIATEPDFGLFDCFPTGNRCRISRPCRLPSVAKEALDAFLAVLRRHSASQTPAAIIASRLARTGSSGKSGGRVPFSTPPR